MAEEEPQVPPPAEASQEPPPAEETNSPALAEEPQPPPAAQETEVPGAAGPAADLKAADAAAAPSSPRPQSAPVRPEDAAKKRSSMVSVTSDGPDYDLSALMSFDPLQQLVGSLVKQQAAQLLLIQGLEAKLDASNGANEALTTALQEALDTKADGAALTELALEQAETAKQVVAVVSGEDPHQEAMTAKLSGAQAHVRELQTELKELRRTLGGKAEQKDVAALDTRLDGYASQKDIEATRELLDAKIAQRAEDQATRSAKLEHVTGVDHAGRLGLGLGLGLHAGHDASHDPDPEPYP